MSRYRTTDKHLPPCVYHKHAGEKLKKFMAEFSPEQVKSKHVAAIKLHLADTPNMANRVLSVLRIVFQYAVEWQLCESNPCIGIKRHDEAKRDRYITGAEYAAIYAVAPPRLQVIMDLLYLTGQRIGDVLSIRYADLTPDGIAFTQQKTNARMVVGWSPDLRATVERARTLHGNLRAKALTDAKQQGYNPQIPAGHTSEAMTDRYIRLREIPQVEGPKLARILDNC